MDVCIQLCLVWLRLAFLIYHPNIFYKFLWDVNLNSISVRMTSWSYTRTSMYRFPDCNTILLLFDEIFGKWMEFEKNRTGKSHVNLLIKKATNRRYWSEAKRKKEYFRNIIRLSVCFELVNSAKCSLSRKTSEKSVLLNTKLIFGVIYRFSRYFIIFLNQARIRECTF